MTLSVENKGQKILVLSSALNCQNCRELDGCSLCSTEGVCELHVFKLPFRTQPGLWVLVESVELLSPNGSQCHYLHAASDWSWWWLPRGTFDRHQLPPSVSPALLLTFAATKTQLCGFFFHFMSVKSCGSLKKQEALGSSRDALIFYFLEASSALLRGHCSHVCKSWQVWQTLWVPRVILHTVHSTYINKPSIALPLINQLFWNQLELIQVSFLTPVFLP